MTQKTIPQTPRRSPAKPGSKPLLSKLEPYLLVFPALVMLILFFFGPALYNFYLSFQKISLFNLHKGGEWVGVKNYAELLTTPTTYLAFKNTTFYLTFMTVAIRLVLGLALALMLDSPILKRWHLSGIARSLILIPWVMPPVVAVAVWKWLLHPQYGAINQLLMQAGFIDSGIPFLVRVSTVWGSIIAIIVWRELPFVVISFLAGLQSVPKELYEAAKIDGASGLREFWHITLPLLKPVITIVTLLSVIWTYNNFVYVWLATKGGPGDFTQVLATQMYTEAFTNFRLGVGSAVGVLMSLIMLLFAVIYYFTAFDRKETV